MSLSQLGVLYLTGFMTTTYFRSLLVTPPQKHLNNDPNRVTTNAYDGWVVMNIIWPCIWPIYLPWLLSWHIGQIVRAHFEANHED